MRFAKYIALVLTKSMDEQQNVQSPTEPVTSNQPGGNGNKLLEGLKSLGGLLGRGILGVMSDEAPSGPPDERERKALAIPEEPQKAQNSEEPSATETTKQ